MDSNNTYQPSNDYRPKKASRTGLILSIILGILVVVAVIEIISVNKNYKRQKEVNTNLASENQRLNGNLVERDSLMNDLMATFDQIENDLNVVKQKRNIISIQSNDPEFRKDKKQAILKDIQMMNSLLDESKTRIASLSKKLKDSGIKIAGLEEKINSLTVALEARDADINNLKKFLEEKDFQMAEMNKNLDSMQVVQVKSQNVIKEQESEINKAYFVYGTYKDLKEKGLLVKEGGLIKKKSLQENLDNKYFTQININEVKTIPIHSKKAHLITEHPTNSYNLVEENGEIAYLEIENPKEFWKISKYAVVETR
jgi:chromosome segregation ATPase